MLNSNSVNVKVKIYANQLLCDLSVFLLACMFKEMSVYKVLLMQQAHCNLHFYNVSSLMAHRNYSSLLACWNMLNKLLKLSQHILNIQFNWIVILIYIDPCGNDHTRQNDLY